MKNPAADRMVGDDLPKKPGKVMPGGAIACIWCAMFARSPAQSGRRCHQFISMPQGNQAWAFGPLVSFETFLMRIPLTLNLEP